MAKVHFKTLGCRLNQAEAERIAQDFVTSGHEVVADPDHADLIVVNTCSVTQAAGAKSRRAAKASKPGQKVVVTGCHSQVRPDEFLAADLVVSNQDKPQLVPMVLEQMGLEGLALGMANPAVPPMFYPLALGHTRAFVKVQDGCNLHCTFCMTTLARGASHSRSADEVLQEVKALADAGCQEVVLTGVHAGAYLDGRETDLGALIDRILATTTIPRLRLSSLEPWNFKLHWVDLWTRYADRLCPHLHMSVQSGSASVLQRMARPYDPDTYAAKLAFLRDGIPNLGVTTDIIVGFPGETNQEHAESLAFIEAMSFSSAHIFTYSSRPGTEAASMPGQVDQATKESRYRDMKRSTSGSAAAFEQSSTGIARVLWEHIDGEQRVWGWTGNYLRVYARPGTAKPNAISNVTLALDAQSRLVGTPVPSPQAAPDPQPR